MGCVGLRHGNTGLECALERGSRERVVRIGVCVMSAHHATELQAIFLSKDVFRCGVRETDAAFFVQ